jgi:hypothetical protein
VLSNDRSSPSTKTFKQTHKPTQSNFAKVRYHDITTHINIHTTFISSRKNERKKKNRKKHRARTFTGKFTFISDERKLRALFKSNFTIIGFKVCPSRVPKSQSVIGNGNKTSISIDIRKCQTILSGKKLQYLFNMGEGGGFPIILLMTLLAHCDEILQGVQVLFSRY